MAEVCRVTHAASKCSTPQEQLPVVKTMARFGSRGTYGHAYGPCIRVHTAYSLLVASGTA
jgi:hypothetical protein